MQRQLFWQRPSKIHFSSLGCKPLLAWGGAEGGRRRGLEWNWTLNVCVQSQHFQFTARRRRSAGIPPHARHNRRGKNGRTGDVPATALDNHLCAPAPVAEGRRRPDRQTDPRWQATHLGGSGSSRAGNSLTHFIPEISVSPPLLPSPRSFRHNRVDTLRKEQAVPFFFFSSGPLTNRS